MEQGYSCVRCGHAGPLLRAPIAAKVGLVALYGFFASTLVASALGGLAIVALGPTSIALCALMQAPLAEAASRHPRCARCGCYAPD